MEAYPINTSHDYGIGMKLPLLEDIGAELDDFLLLSLLGISAEARQSIRTILWRHLRYFPVFAEVADYVVAENDPLLQMELLDSIRCGNIEFADSDERTFLNGIEEILSDERSVVAKWNDGMVLMTDAFTDWKSPILCHLLQIRMMVVTRDPDRVSDYIYCLRQYLTISRLFIERQMLKDAIRCFSIATSSTLPTEHRDILALQLDLEHMLRTLLGLLNGGVYSDQDEGGINQQNTDALVVRISYLRFLDAAMSFDDLSYKSLASRVNELLPDTWKLIHSAFAGLPDPCPRGECFRLCEKLKSPELAAIGNSTEIPVYSAPDSSRHREINATTTGLGPASTCIAPDYEHTWALFSEFKLRTGPAAMEFFVKGRVFAIVWHETFSASNLAHPNATEISAALDVPFHRYFRSADGVTIFSYVRPFVVLYASHMLQYCSAIPIKTYRGQEIDHRTAIFSQEQDHAIIHAEHTEPVEKAGEIKVDTRTIAVSGATREALPSSSRLYYGEVQHIALNVKVKDIGRICDSEDLRRLPYFTYGESFEHVHDMTESEQEDSDKEEPRTEWSMYDNESSSQDKLASKPKTNPFLNEGIPGQYPSRANPLRTRYRNDSWDSE